MWTSGRLLEGEVSVDQPYRDARDLDPPVLHVELMNTPVVNEETGAEISDHLYVYWKNGPERMERAGVQGGTIPIRIGNKSAVEPYGWANHESPADDTSEGHTAELQSLMPLPYAVFCLKHKTT